MKFTVNVHILKREEFKTMFYDKYFTKNAKARKVKEFLELKQGGMIVHDYVLKFEEGCQFVSYIDRDDNERIDHFIRGLRAEIKRDVRMSKATGYKEIVDKTLMAEQDEKEIERERQ